MNTENCIRSKSTSNIEELIIKDEASTDKACFSELMEILEDECAPFEKTEYFQRVHRILELHYLFIKDLSLRDIVPIEKEEEELASKNTPRLYHHIDFEAFTKSLFKSDDCKKNENKFFPCLIKNLITYMANTGGIFANICVFNISIQKICSLLENDEAYLTEICLVLLKVVLNNNENRSVKEKYQLMVRLNEVNDELASELNENEHINSLSIDSKLKLCEVFLEELRKHYAGRFEDGKQKIGSMNDLSLSFWRFKSCESFLFIERNNQDWLYVNKIDTIKKIYELVPFEKQLSQDLITNSQVRNSLKTLTLDINNNPVVDDEPPLYKVPSVIEVSPEDSIIFESTACLSETIELDSFVTEEHLSVFDIESDLKKEQKSLQQSYLELDILLLIKKLLVAGFTNSDITLNADHLIQSFTCGPVFESVDLKSVLDYREERFNIKEPELDEQLEPIFGSAEWKILSKSLRIDVTLADTLYLNLKMHNFKSLINLIFHTVPQRFFSKKFTKYKHQAWLNCVHNSYSRKNLRLLLFILDENINWSESLEHVKCHICDVSLEVCEIYSMIKSPQQFIKETCQICGLVFHLNCYQANKCVLYGSKKIQKDYLKKDYQCCKCSKKERVEYLVTDYVTVNNRTLRNTVTRKLKSYKLLNEEAPKPNKRKNERTTSKSKVSAKSCISDLEETDTIDLSESPDELPLSQIKKRRV